MKGSIVRSSSNAHDVVEIHVDTCAMASSFCARLGSRLLEWAVVTRRTNVCIWLLALGSMACGGNTVATKQEQDPTPMPTTDPRPQPGTAGSGSAEPSPGHAGTSSLQPEPTCEGPQPVCVPDCEALQRATSECLQGQYHCPNSWVDLDSCSKDACARRARNCCSDFGQPEYPECADDGTIGQCPAGFEQRSPCVPAGLDITSCDDIPDGSACASDQLICVKDRCGRNCRCEADLDGQLLWRCRVNAC